MQFSDLVNTFLDLIQAAIPVIAGLALLAFFWGIVKFLMSASEGEIKEGKSLLVWGTIAIFVMVSVWGILRFASGEFQDVGFSWFLPLLPSH